MTTTTETRLTEGCIESEGRMLRIRHIGGIVSTVFDSVRQAEAVREAIRDYVDRHNITATSRAATIVLEYGIAHGRAV